MADSEDALVLQRRARRRLVGAIALVVFTVIVLPIVFDKERPPERQDLVLQIPSQDAPRASARVVPPPEAAAKAPAPSAPTAAVAAPEAPASAPAQTAPEPAPQAERQPPAQSSVSSPKAEARPTAARPSEPAATPTDEPARTLPAAKAVPTAGKETPASRERFVVALGAYNDRNVKQLTTKISSAGYRAFTEKVPNKADQHRLRAGPFTTRAAAEEAREKLKAQGFADAVVRQDP